MSEYKMIVLDLDGTLTNRNKEITPKTKETLMKAQEQGKIVVLVNGSPSAMVLPALFCENFEGGFVKNGAVFFEV